MGLTEGLGKSAGLIPTGPGGGKLDSIGKAGPGVKN